VDETRRVRALYVGRVAPEKNLDLLARVFAGRVDVDLTIVGDGPSSAELQQRLPGARFTGRLTGDALTSAYREADFFVFPSRTDTLGNVVLEAMASGLPAVVTDSMGPKELVDHGRTGFVAGSDAAFAAAVDTLVADRALRRAMGAAARRFAETRSWDAIFAQLLRYYEQTGAAVARPLPRPRGPARPLCILDITEFFGETSGGVKTYLMQKARYVESRRGVRAVVVVPGESHTRRDEAGVRWYQVRGPRIPTQRPYRLMIDAARIREIVETERPDVIEVGSHFVVPWLVGEAARAAGTPVVWFCHSNLPRILAPYPDSAWARQQAAAVSRRYMRRLSRRCAATLAPSDALALELEAMGIANVRRVSLGVDVDRFDAERRGRRDDTRRRLGLPSGPLLLYAGRITSEKGVDLLLDAWPLIERETSAHLALVGDGPAQARLRARCRSDRVHWRPYEPDRERLADLMAAADLYVAPSVVETFGLAALEAMACDTPVLSADSGAVADHVKTSGAGAVFASGSASSLAGRAVELVRRGLPALRRRGHAYVAGLSWAKAFDRIFAVYDQVRHARA
jgi:alpha-1,6-mannosyltransferase